MYTARRRRQVDQWQPKKNIQTPIDLAPLCAAATAIVVVPASPFAPFISFRVPFVLCPFGRCFGGVVASTDAADEAPGFWPFVGWVYVRPGHAHYRQGSTKVYVRPGRAPLPLGGWNQCRCVLCHVRHAKPMFDAFIPNASIVRAPSFTLFGLFFSTYLLSFNRVRVFHFGRPFHFDHSSQCYMRSEMSTFIQSGMCLSLWPSFLL